jgi:hypothetical protein
MNELRTSNGRQTRLPRVCSTISNRSANKLKLIETPHRWKLTATSALVLIRWQLSDTGNTNVHEHSKDNFEKQSTNIILSPFEVRHCSSPTNFALINILNNPSTSQYHISLLNWGNSRLGSASRFRCPLSILRGPNTTPPKLLHALGDARTGGRQ